MIAGTEGTGKVFLTVLPQTPGMLTLDAVRINLRSLVFPPKL